MFRSTDTRLMGSDRVSERKMLMNEHVSKMFLVYTDIIIGFGSRVGVWKVIEYPALVMEIKM